MANKKTKNIETQSTQQSYSQQSQQQLSPPQDQPKSEFLQMYDAFLQTYQTFNNNQQNQPSLVFDFNAFNTATTNRVYDSTGKKYSKENMRTYFANPEKYEKQIRECSIYLYNSIQEYKHLIDYMAKMLTHDYILIPDNIVELNKSKNSKKMIDSFYENLEFIDNYNIKSKLSTISPVLLREDIYFGYERSDGDNYIWQRLPNQYSRLLGWDEFGCLTFEFDFSYFGKNGLNLEYFDKEFTKKYNAYKSGDSPRWQQLDDNAICFKFDPSVLYGLPYFSGIFTDLMGLEDYKDDQEETNRANNYKLIALEIPVFDKEKGINQYLITLDHVAEFVSNASKITPQKIGIFAFPGKSQAINLNNSNSHFEENIVNKAQNDLMTSAGVSKLIGNSEKTSVGLERSIQDDEATMFSILRQYELWFKKRLIMFNKNKKMWKLSMLNTTIYNVDKVFERYLKSSNAGLPKSLLIASMNMSQGDFIGLAKLENELGLVDDMLKVLPSSATTPGNIDDKGGNPGKKVEDKQDSGIVTDDLESNKNKTFVIEEDEELEEEI